MFFIYQRTLRQYWFPSYFIMMIIPVIIIIILVVLIKWFLSFSFFFHLHDRLSGLGDPVLIVASDSSSWLTGVNVVL